MAKRNDASLLVLVATVVVVFLSVQVKSAMAAGSYTTAMQEAVRNEMKVSRDVLPGFIRLLFHDCFVNGCDGSVLLETSRINGTKGKTEMTSPFNGGLRDLQVIQNIKNNLWDKYGITCTDAVIYAAREAVYLLSNGKIAYNVDGPGRMDGVISRSEDPEKYLPTPRFTFDQLKESFRNKGFNETELVALSGAHAVGIAHSSFFLTAIEDTPPEYRQAIGEETNFGTKDVVKNNVRDFNKHPSTYKPMVGMSAKNVLDNSFYNAVPQKMALFPSDRVLWVAAKVNVTTYRDNAGTWYRDFGYAMEKLSKLAATSDPANIEIRKVCSKTN
ncbi:peroxidase 5-like [Triticum dicoccoides]|uniref:peroxidase 5-like n=1 Tax=Triticum dicoccoides TaxID=85692 RepID=UPI000E7A673F|nr:peroxidase 5-like [Triticum dicoccoides]